MKIATWLFLVFGAIQVFCPATKAETLDFAIIADGGEWNSSARLTRDSVLRTPIRSLILPGDNLYNSNYANVWGNWSQNGFTFDVPAIGNHNDGYEAEMAFFRMPGEYFSKVYPGIARFIVLNSDNNSTGSTQASFLDSELTAATEPFVFLVYHHPTYTLSHFHGWKDKKKFQQAIRPVLWRHRAKITALLLGHDHLALLAHFNDLPVIISGASKDQRSDTPINNTQDGVAVRTGWFYDRNAYWAKLRLDSVTREAQVGFIRSRDQRESCTATLVTGRAALLSSNCSGQ